MMKTTPWMMYWITRLDDLKKSLDAFGGILMVLGIIGSLTITACYMTEGIDRRYLWLWIVPIIGAVFSSIALLIPTEKDIAAIIVVPKLLNNKKIAALPSKFTDFATEWLDSFRPKK